MESTKARKLFCLSMHREIKGFLFSVTDKTKVFEALLRGQNTF